MGAYLSQPITEKESADTENEFLVCGSSSMQGWRMTQEDAHNTELNFDRNASFFAVYDGHGGAEVAQYCAQNLPAFLKLHEEYKKGNFEAALKQAFLEFDATLVQESIAAILQRMAKRADSETEGEDDLDELRQEGHMPIEELIERYREVQRNHGRIAEALDELAPTPDVENGHSSGASSSRASDAKLSDDAVVPAIKKEPIEDSIEDSISAATKAIEDASPASIKIEKVEDSPAAIKIEKVEDSPAAIKIEKVEDSTSAAAAVESVTNGEAASKSPNTTVSASSLNGESPSGSSSSSATKEPKQPTNAGDEESSSDDDDEDESYKYANGSDDDVAAESDDDDDDEDNEDDDDDDEDEEVDDDDDREVYPGREEDDGFLTNMCEAPGSSSGCTAVVALLADRELYVANAGDSRCVVCRDGKALEMSFDHKPEDEEESERIRKAGGRVTMDGRVNGGLNLSRALGDHGYKRNEELKPEEQMISALPDVRHLSIQPTDDFIILACDGIWNFMSSDEVVEFVKERLAKGCEKLSTICEELFTHCLADNTQGDGTGCDNMTAVLIRFKPSFHQKSSKRCASPETDIAEAAGGDSAKRIKTDNDETAIDDSTAETVTAPAATSDSAMSAST